MRYFLKLILLFASLNLGAQETEDATDFLTGLIVSNATEVTTATKIPVLDANLKMNTWITAANLLDGLVSGSGTTNYLAKFTAAGTVGKSIVYNNGTKVGIGTTTPEAFLEVTGNVSGSVTPLRSLFKAKGNVTSTNGYNLFYGIGGSTFALGVVTGLRIDLTGGTSGVHYGVNIDGEDKNYFSNKIGVGTTTPEALIEGTNSDPTRDFFRLSSSTATSGDVFKVHKNERVGIGAPEPSAQLEVVNETGVVGVFKGQNGKTSLVGHIIELDRADSNVFRATSVGGYLDFVVNGNLPSEKAVTIASSGNVGMGTGTPEAALDVESTTSGLLIPRMTTVQREAITVGVNQTGLQVYDTTTNTIWLYNGTEWGELGLSKTVAKGEFRSLVDQYANNLTETLIDFEVRIGLQNVEWDNTNKTIKNTSQNDITLHLEPQIGRRSTGSVVEIEIWVDISDDGINWDPLDGYAIFKNITNSTSSVAPLTTVLTPGKYARFGMILDTSVTDTGIISNGQGATNPGASLSGRVVPSVELNITNN